MKKLNDPDERGKCVVCGDLGSGTGTDGKTYCSPDCARKNNAEQDIIDDEDAQSFDDVEIPQYAEPDDDNEGLVETGSSNEVERGLY
jgi:hypothetical protein